MKKLLFTLCAVINLFVQAGSYVDQLSQLSWQELKDHEDVDFLGVQINFDGTFISRLDVCLSDADTLRTINKVRIEEYDGEDFNFVGYDFLYRSLNYTRVYVDGDSTVDVIEAYKVTKDIKVVQWDDDFDGDFLFYKEHTIKSCN